MPHDLGKQRVDVSLGLRTAPVPLRPCASAFPQWPRRGAREPRPVYGGELQDESELTRTQPREAPLIVRRRNVPQQRHWWRCLVHRRQEPIRELPLRRRVFSLHELLDLGEDEAVDVVTRQRHSVWRRAVLRQRVQGAVVHVQPSVPRLQWHVERLVPCPWGRKFLNDPKREPLPQQAYRRQLGARGFGVGQRAADMFPDRNMRPVHELEVSEELGPWQYRGRWYAGQQRGQPLAQGAVEVVAPGSARQIRRHDAATLS
mmetsp:Transcript_66434/g.185122  ORF Transcript_66434/g.185122 Transcript_66434/m.185122 type:complete len:259 (+) Transcript_66434:380-1156(+)